MKGEYSISHQAGAGFRQQSRANRQDAKTPSVLLFGVASHALSALPAIPYILGVLASWRLISSIT
jgi:hypothetical protein